MDVELTQTADGSPTLYLPELDEHYHSTKGAVSESIHVYINEGLCHRLKSPIDGNELKVLEIGFGTGLNTALSASLTFPENLMVNYFSIEKFPLNPEIVKALDFGEILQKSVFEKIHEADWNQHVKISANFTLTKLLADFLSDSLPADIDVVYMDAFGPDKQPEMWTPEVLERLSSVMRPGGVLTTYSAKGSVRRALQAAGLKTERLPGPPGGKREILRATKYL